jgi:AraC family transcriptional regulator
MASAEIALQGMAVRTNRYRPNQSMGPHTHESGSLTFVYRGGLIERTANGEEIAAPLSAVVKPPGVLHSDRFGPDGASVVQIIFEPDLLDSWSNEWSMGTWRWIHGGPPTRPFLRVLSALRQEGLDRDEVESLVLELLTEFDALPPQPESRTPPRWLRTVRDRIASQFEGSLRVRDLAADAQVHPVSLARAFRRHYGDSITAALRRHRVRAAAIALTAEDRPLADLALSAGFSDQAHFCRVFKSTTGLSPGRFRHLCRH